MYLKCSSIALALSRGEGGGAGAGGEGDAQTKDVPNRFSIGRPSIVLPRKYISHRSEKCGPALVTYLRRRACSCRLPGPMKPFATHLQEGTQRRSDPSREHDQNHRALDTDAVARKLLAAAAQGRQEVSVSKRGLFYGLQGVLGRWGFLRKDVHGRTM